MSYATNDDSNCTTDNFALQNYKFSVNYKKKKVNNA